MQRLLGGIALGCVLLVVLSACGGNSDTISILQSENTALRATLEAYQGLGPTATAQAIIMAEKLAAAQSQLSTLRAQVNDLTLRINSQSSQQTAQVQPAQPTPGANPAATPAPGGTPASTPTGLAFDQLITTKAKDAYGCAVGQANLFNPSEQIWVIAKVFNLKGNIPFNAKWSGAGISDQYSWNVNNNGAPICVHFYIEANSLKAGDYTVTLSAPGATAATATFKVQGAGTGSDVASTSEAAIPK